jgi:hypothetical protein
MLTLGRGVRPSLVRPAGIPRFNPRWSQIAGLADAWVAIDGGAWLNLSPSAASKVLASGNQRSQVTKLGVGAYTFSTRKTTLPIVGFGASSSTGWTFRFLISTAGNPNNATIIENAARVTPYLYFSNTGA